MKVKINPNAGKKAPGVPGKEEKQPVPEKPVQQHPQAPKRKQTIISKCIGVIIDDINWKLRGIKSPERVEWERKQEIYESFYKAAKGEK